MNTTPIKLNFYGTDYDIYFTTDTYCYGGGLYIGLCCKNEEFNEYEPFANLTVNLDRYPPITADTAFVDENNLPNICKWIEENHLGTFTKRIGQSGFCIYKEYKFNMDEISKHLLPTD